MRLPVIILLPILFLLPALRAEEQPGKENETAEQKESPEMAAERKKVEALIAQLGSDKFEEREAAEWELKVRGSPVLPLVRKAMEEAKDPEVKARLHAFENLWPPKQTLMSFQEFLKADIKNLLSIRWNEFVAHAAWRKANGAPDEFRRRKFLGIGEGIDESPSDAQDPVAILLRINGDSVLEELQKLRVGQNQEGLGKYSYRNFLDRVIKNQALYLSKSRLEALGKEVLPRLEEVKRLSSGDAPPSQEDWKRLKQVLGEIDEKTQYILEKDRSYRAALTNDRVAMAMEGAHPVDVLSILCFQLGVRVFFDPPELITQLDERRVSVEIDRLTGAQALPKILDPIGLDFRIEESGPYREGRVVVFKKKEEGKAEAKDVPPKDGEKK